MLVLNYELCIFCDIIESKQDAHIAYDDGAILAFLDKYPIDHGHCLVIPKTHYEKITDMPVSGVGELFQKVAMISTIITSVTGASGFTLSQNNGHNARQIIPHVHVHIIPRYSSTGAVWTKRQIGDYDKLSKLAKSLRDAMFFE